MKKQLFCSLPVTCHTDFVTAGSTFVSIKGLKEDGSSYLATAIQRGATKIVVQQGTVLSEEVQNLVDCHCVTVEYVENTRKALALLSAEAAGYPAQKLKFFGVGGTKGKTTTVSMLAHLLKLLGKKVAFLSTALISIDTGKDELVGFDCAGTLTTPQPDYLHQFLKLCVEKGVEYVVLEVAVQAHTFFRIEGIEFEGVIFTNLDREHGELYPSMDEYFAEKQKLFEHLKAGGALLANGDDAYGQKVLQKYPRARSFGSAEGAAYRGALLSDTLIEQQALMEYCGAKTHYTYQSFPGSYNFSNFLGALSLLTECGFETTMLSRLRIAFPPVPGRLEMKQLSNGALAVIDYAHTAASFEQVLTLMRPRTDQLIVVFGAGGGKDTQKRSGMGQAAGRIADVILVTDDNPRHEDPALIAEQILSGVRAEDRHKVQVIHDRGLAIEKAYAISHAGSIIMLLGKGPDDVQIVGSQRIFFSEVQVLDRAQHKQL